MKTITIQRAVTCRLVPNRAQRETLDTWDDACRVLWNAALEQRLRGLDCGGPMIVDDKTGKPRRAVRAFYRARTDGKVEWVGGATKLRSQCKQLTEVREALDWMSAVPCCVQQNTLSVLDDAWSRYFFKRIGGPPKWKSKRRGDRMSFRFDRTQVRVEGGRLRLPVIGWVRLRGWRGVDGEIRNVTIKLDVDRWSVVIGYRREQEAPVPRVGPVVAIDRGVTWAAATSDGELIENPRFYAAQMRTLAHAQRVMKKRFKRGAKEQSRGYEKAKNRVARLHRKVRRQRDQWTHALSARLAKSHGVVVLEDLQILNMVKSAAGTVEQPGRNVRAKSGLNRSILDAGWGSLSNKLAYKLEERGGQLEKVPPAYSSQTCSCCGVVSPDSRSGERFRCVACGHEDHADINAAKVLLTRRLDGVEAGGGDRVSEPAKPEPSAHERTVLVNQHGQVLLW